MRGFRRSGLWLAGLAAASVPASLFAGLLAITLSSDRAEAFAPSADERRRFTALILQANKELTQSAKPDLDKARRTCTDARDLARRFDANSYWNALIEDCFAAVAETDRDTAAACKHYRGAADWYGKVGNDPKARSVETDLARVAQARQRLGCIAPVVAAAVEPGRDGPLTEDGLRELVARTSAAQKALAVKNPAAARESCEDARAVARRHLANGYAAGLVEECFGAVDIYEKNQGVACTRYGLALTHYASAKRGELGSAQADAQRRVLQRVRGKLKC